jgi:PAB1-binding protein PBP1
VGQNVIVNTTDGTILEGIFHTFTPFDGSFDGPLKNKYVFKACKAVKGGDFDTGATLILQADQVSSVFCKSLRLDTKNGNSREEGFRTDVEISGARDGEGRDLVAAGSAWTSGQKHKTGGLGDSIGKWDQFKANEQLFDVRATFDENLYTTELDHSQVDARRRLEAQRLAKEIEGTASSNIHIAEERGQAMQGDYDEEDRYSGVLKSSLQPRNVAAAKPELKAPVPKKMNYAAAAAKADAKAAIPPGFKATVVSPRKNEPKEEKKEETTTETAPEETSAKEKTPTPVTSTPVEEEAKKSTDTTTEVADKADEPMSDGEKAPEEKLDEKKEEKKPAPKLNPNAKSFSFNPSAKSFTPTFGAPAPPVEYYYPVDPNTGVPMGGPGAMQMQGQPQYVPYQGMGQPGECYELIVSYERSSRQSILTVFLFSQEWVQCKWALLNLRR